jgi:hypothetical protein
MLHYEVDDYVQEQVSGEAVNVNCVESWRARADARGAVWSLFVDIHNSWVFDSRHWHGLADAPGRILCALQRNEAVAAVTGTR